MQIKILKKTSWVVGESTAYDIRKPRGFSAIRWLVKVDHRFLILVKLLHDTTYQ